ncbi:MAG TPA: hypothetical protein VLI90_05125 [Tepidisphaeraceae bacterium]|nr:hypothetical protein [Tepidisphaeraceae bacterium]
MTADPGVSTESDDTGLPALRTWPAVYLFVLVVFVIWVALLIALERTYS